MIFKIIVAYGTVWAFCANRFRATGNHLWLIPWAIMNPTATGLLNWKIKRLEREVERGI